MNIHLSQWPPLVSHCSNRSDSENAATSITECAQTQIGLAAHYADRFRLLTTKKENGALIPECKFQWFLNIGLLKNIYDRTDDPQLRKLISFLAYNYLGKAAPICPNDLNIHESQKQELYNRLQLSLLEPGISYNREFALFDPLIHHKIYEMLAPTGRGLLFLTDAKNFEDLFPLLYSVIDTPIFSEKISTQEAETSRAAKLRKKVDSSTTTFDQILEKWSLAFTQKILLHFEAYPHDPFSKFSELPLLIDLTHLLGDEIFTSNDVKQNKFFEEKIRTLENLLEKAIDQAAVLMCPENPKKMKAWVITNLNVVCRPTLNEVDLLVVLPMFYDTKYLTFDDQRLSMFGETKETSERLAFSLLDTKFSKSKAEMEQFLNVTGIRLGGVSGREKVFNFISLEQFLASSNSWPVTYSPNGTNSVCFKRKSDLIESALFKRAENLFSQAENSSFLSVLGKPTVELLKGLFDEIDEKAWSAANENPELRELIQTTLYKIHEHLAMAELFQHDFVKFTQKIELIHYEMAALLAVFMPFKKDDFSGIYRNRLSMIPEELSAFVQAGLAKSAMNLFAGVNAALMQQEPHPIRVIDPGSHFEIFQFLGESCSFDHILNNEEFQRIDLYLGEFNHNVKLSSKHDTYQPGNIIQEVETLLKAKPQTEKLTIAVDCTIDYVNSPKVRKLLSHFSSEILQGHLNFIFFRSGQKFDMLGMDNYYGSPFYMVNNRASHWAAFDTLIKSDTFQTDSLSTQWFSLINKYAPNSLDQYRSVIFDNTQKILAKVPPILLPGNNPKVKVCTVSEGTETCFLDLKCFDASLCRKLESLLYQIFLDGQALLHTRGGYGYFNANLNLFMKGLDKSDSSITMRLNPGINPAENALIVSFLEKVAQIIAED